MNSELLLEEYRFAVSLINRHDDRIYQLLIVNVTAFAAIFGLSSQIAIAVVPIALLGVLLVCVNQSLSNFKLLHFNIAFIIEKFEKAYPQLNHETGFYSWVKKSRRAPIYQTTSLFELANRIIHNVYLILMLVSLFGGTLFVRESLVNYWFSGREEVVIAYIALISVGHATVLYMIRANSKFSIAYFRNYWREYLVNEEK